MHRGGDDDRRAGQEREPRCVLVIEPGQIAADHGSSGAGQAGDQGEALEAADDDAVAPAHLADRLQRRGGLHALGGEQHQAVDCEEDGGGERRGEQLADRLFEGEGHQHGGNGRNDHTEEQLALMRSAGADADHAEAEVEPVLPEIDQQRQGRAHVHHHQEGQERVAMLVDGPVQKIGHNDRVAQARHREEFGHALQYRQEDRLQPSHEGFLCAPRPACRAGLCSVPTKDARAVRSVNLSQGVSSGSVQLCRGGSGMTCAVCRGAAGAACASTGA